jgi:two-component system chemotaxis sensor kinase CheA
MRALHTVKGNCGLYGIGSVVEVAHRLESAILERATVPTLDDLSDFVLAWGVFADRVRRLLGTEQPVIEIAYEELEELEAAAAARAPYARLGELLERLKLERGSVRLRRVAEQAKHLAKRLGKVGLDVQVEVDSHVRFPAERWAPFWSAFVHVLRNALDHGIEAPEARKAAGKSAGGLLRLSAHASAQRLCIEVGDDGCGIDWERVRLKARQRGLPHATDQDLVEALFSDGLSLAEAVNDISGRGVGMGAVRDAARALGGTVHISSRRGAGCTVRFDFPLAEATRLSRASQHPGARPSLAPSPPRPLEQELTG